ncbi:MAG TPA: SufS family cysteine desulfurase [Candidatus Woesebacteria bacterium]|nr:SufS family cysteine desulfurase [Candidatus Woesebacteria bacterium]
MLNIKKIKADFPIFQNQPDLIYLDNAATSQKPQAVIDRLVQFYANENANVHRGVYPLSERASEAYNLARKKVAQFIGAQSSSEIIFTKGATESLNLVAQSFAIHQLKSGDELLVSDFEHHSNFLPWRDVCDKTGAILKVLNSDQNGFIAEEEWQKKLTKKTKLVAIAHASNVLGTISDIKNIAQMVHAYGALLVVDGAQAIPHLQIDVQALNCDFYAFSGHKMLAPMGIGVLYAKAAILNQMLPYQLGGGMIESVSLDKVVFAPYPEKFEAGTPNVAGGVALAAAIDYLEKIGLAKIRAHEIALSRYLLNGLAQIKKVRVFGQAAASERTGLVSFYVEGVHAHDLSDFLAKKNLALRAGFHCAMPLHQSHACGATLRASYYLYNSEKDLESLLINLTEAINYYG